MSNRRCRACALVTVPVRPVMLALALAIAGQAAWPQVMAPRSAASDVHIGDRDRQLPGWASEPRASDPVRFDRLRRPPVPPPSPPMPAATIGPYMPQVPGFVVIPVLIPMPFHLLLPAPVMQPGMLEALHEPGELLVLWPSEHEAARGQIILQQYGAAVQQRHVLGALDAVLALLVLRSEQEALALRDRLRAAQPGWTVDLNARSSPRQAGTPRLYARELLGVAPPMAPRTGGPVLRMGVVDTGLAPQAMQPALLNGSNVRMRNLLEPLDIPAATAHGEAVLQLIASVEKPSGFGGAAPPLELFWAAAMRELGGRPVTSTLTLARALDWLVAQRVALINLSLGGAGDAVLRDIVARVLAKDIAIVAAAGNDPSPEAAPVYPAAYPGVWSVTAVDANGRLHGQATRSPATVLAAPGVEVWVPVDAYVSGTSFATALASATLAWQPAAFWRLPLSQRLGQVCAQALRLQAEHTGCGLVRKPQPSP